MGIQVRFLGVQKWHPKGGQPSFKCNYSAMNNKTGDPMKLDDGTEATLSYYGEKPVDIKCTPEAFDILSQLQPGSLCDLEVSPNPVNLRMNICTGGKKWVKPS